METLVTFAVDDTSPCVSYSPLSETLSTPNLTAGWNPYFNVSGFNTVPGAVGVGTSQHITALDGASLALQWRGTGITLMGNVTNDASYNITVDGQIISLGIPSPSSDVLADIHGLNDTAHNIVVTAMIPPPTGSNPPNSSILVFESAIVFSSPVSTSSNLTLSQSTIVDSDIAFSGLWSIEPTNSSSGGPQFHTSETAGDKAFAEFNGTTLLILGRTSPDAGNYTVTLDAGNATSTIIETLSALSLFRQDNALLFFASELDPTVSHTVQVVNDGGELALAVNGFEAFAPQLQVVTPTPGNSTSNSTSTVTSGVDSGSGTVFEPGTIAAFALAGILAFILITGALFFFLVYQPRRRRRRAPSSLTFAASQKQSQSAARRQSAKEQEANGVGLMPGVLNIAPTYNDEKDMDVEADNADAAPGPRRFSALSEGFQRWGREAVRGSLGGISLGIKFRHSDSPVATANVPGGDAGSNEGEESVQRSRSDRSSWTESSGAARRREEKRIGKMRQITGRSWSRSPSFNVELGSGSSDNYRYSKRYSRRQSRGINNFPSASAATAAVGAAVATAAAGRVVPMDRSSSNGAEPAPRVRPLPQPHPYQMQEEPLAEHQAAQAEEPLGPPSYAASISLSLSAPSNPSNSNSQSDPSPLQVPRSVSHSPAPATYPRVQHRNNSSVFLLHDLDAEGEGDPERQASNSPDDGHSPPTQTRRVHYDLSTPVAAGAMALRAQRRERDTAPRDVIRSLSPRTSTAPRQLPIPPQQQRQHSRWQPEPLDVEARAESPQSPESESPDSATSPTSRPLLPKTDSSAGRSSRTIKALPQTPTSDTERYEEDDAEDDGAAFLSVRQTSPFRVDFDSSSTRPASRIRPLPSPTAVGKRKFSGAASDNGSADPDLYFTPSTNSSVGQSSSSNEYGGIGTSGVPARRSTLEFQQGTSRQPFRLTPMTFPTSSAIPSISTPESPTGANDPSPANSDGVISFLDFGNSREPSISTRSDKERPPRSLPLPPILVEPKSRWSNTTVPSIATTNLGAGASTHNAGNESSGESNLGDRRAGGATRISSTASSTFPIPFQANIPPSPHHIMDPVPSTSGTTAGVPSQSTRTSALTQHSSNELHVHPVLEDIDSPTDSIPMTVSTDIQFMHSGSENDPNSRRTTDQGSLALQAHGHPPLPSDAAATVDEHRPRPFDPSLLVSRVLGLPSPTSTSTLQPGYSRSASAAVPSSGPSSRSDLNSSNDRLNTIGRRGPSTS